MSKIDLDAALDEQNQSIEPNPLAMKSGDVFKGPDLELQLSKVTALARIKFAPYERAANEMIAQANAVVVIDQETHSNAVEVGTRAKKIGKEIETKLKEARKPYDDISKTLKQIIQPFIDKCDQAENVTKQKNRDYLSKVELERLKAQKAMEEAQKKVQDQINAEAKAAGVEAPQIPKTIIKEEKITTHTVSGSAYTKKRKDFKILNLSLVPREYLEAAIAKEPEKFLRTTILQKIKEGVEEIAGIQIFETEDVVYRT